MAFPVSTRRGSVAVVKMLFPPSRPVPARLAIYRVSTLLHYEAW